MSFMKFFWNIRGLGKPARKRQLKELIVKERFDMIGVQETIKKDFADRDLQDLAGNGNFGWLWSSAIGHSVDILMGVRKDELDIEGGDQG